MKQAKACLNLEPLHMDRIKALLLKSIREGLEPLEQQELNDWINQEEANRELYQELHDEPRLAEAMQKLSGIDEKLGWQKLQSRLADQKSNTNLPVHRVHFLRRSWVRYAAAAVVVFAVATTYLLLTKKNTPVADMAKLDVKAPESNKARITLGSGKTIYLDTVANGKTIEVDGVRLTKLADGRIVYASDASLVTSIVYNTATNPRGSKVMDLELNDHSHVWLNAGSSISYPVVFTGKERKVNIIGEAYFEVAHDPSRPFIVSKGNTSVQVLGTHFNVKAYDNDADIKVTLLEGSVNVTGKNAKQILKPGQQAIVKDETIELKTEVDVNAATAWLHGKTVLESVSLEEVLKEIERWYDIRTEIRTRRPKDDTFFARISRDAPLSEMLKTLQQNNVKYEYDPGARKLIIQ